MGGWAYTYDANGNLTSGQGKTLTWNVANQPTSITANGVTEAYDDDADGQRLVRSASGVTTVSIGGQYEEDLPSGTTRTVYTLNGQTIAQRTTTGATSTVLYLHSDQLGSVSAATNANGALVSRQDFGPWGTIRSGGIAETTVNFTGQRRDGTGLLYYNARYYDPSLARFVSADSVVPGTKDNVVGLVDGAKLTSLTVDFHEPGFVSTVATENGQLASKGFFQKATTQTGPANPQALNRYAYGLNNPVRYTDPTGHWTLELDLGAALMSVIGVRGNFSFAIDGYGNYGLLGTLGAGAAVGGKFGSTFGGTWSSAPTIADLQGTSVQFGADAAAVLGGSVEGAAFRDSRNNVQGAVSVGLTAGVALEIHGTATKSWLLVKRNIKQDIRKVMTKLISNGLRRNRFGRDIIYPVGD